MVPDPAVVTKQLPTAIGWGCAVRQGYTTELGNEWVRARVHVGVEGNRVIAGFARLG